MRGWWRSPPETTVSDDVSPFTSMKPLDVMFLRRLQDISSRDRGDQNRYFKLKQALFLILHQEVVVSRPNQP